MEQQKKLLFELGTELFLSVLGVWMMAESFQSSKQMFTVGNNMGPMVFPRIIIGLFLFLMVIDMIRVVCKLRSGSGGTAGESGTFFSKPMVLTLAAMCVYTIFWNIVGFTISTVVFLTTETKVVNSDIPLRNAAAVAVGVAVLLNVIFGGLFKMSFPEPLLMMIRGY